MNAWVYACRGQEVENRHRVSLAIYGQEGLLAYGGNPGLWTYMRSSAKPFQALALYLTGAVERFGLSEEEVALATASHDGTPRHVEVASRFLAKLGLGPEALVCGVHPPFSKEARKALEKAGQSPTPLHHNCSGKHAGMLAVSLALGASPEGYESPDHPTQRLNLQTLWELSGIKPKIATDGCSVPHLRPAPFPGRPGLLPAGSAPKGLQQLPRTPKEGAGGHAPPPGAGGGARKH